MRRFAQFAVENGVDGVLFDIDDTLTTDGKITGDAYAAMSRLKMAGMLVVPITGRPAGWCDHIARMWPVDAVVGENGAFYFGYDAAAGRIIKRFMADDAIRKQNRQRLAEVAAAILAAVPGAALAADHAYREADIAIDFCEEVPRLPDAAISRIKDLMEVAGLTAKVSSIHVNGWFGEYDKLTTTQKLFNELFGINLATEKSRYVFVGDSPNDQPMFAYFPNSVGVANIADFISQLTTPPTFVTDQRCGAGFVEVVNRLVGLQARD